MATNQTRIQRRAEALRIARPVFNRGSLTTVRAVSPWAAVHLGFFEGSYESTTLCGALAGREVETVDEISSCADCAWVVRHSGHEYLIKDEDGWTGLYQPRAR